MTAPQRKTTSRIYFTDVFDISPKTLEKFGAMNIALINDLPLFIDPFLLYDSPKRKYRKLHDDIIDYLCFVRDRAVDGELTDGAVVQWLYFKEVKQNWLGFSKTGNAGTGLGKEFAESLGRNLKSVFKEFGNETLSEGSHIEKLGLLSGGVGRDHLSDFTTNLIKQFLLKYTESFARKHLRAEQRKRFNIERVTFNYETRRWTSGYFELPSWCGDYVILTPKEILTRDEAWINQGDMLNSFQDICRSLPDGDLRAQVNEHFYSQITKRTREKERRLAALSTVEKFHELMDYYVRWKEENAEHAHSQSNAKVRDSEKQFIENISALVNDHLAKSSFYLFGNSYEDSLKRVGFLKDVIENKGGHRLFYVKGKPIQREVDLHVMFRLTWFGTALDVNAEVNNGRGPVDFKVSFGRKNASLVEFKLAKNTSLEKNLQHQVKIYENASDTKRSIKVIMYFTTPELRKVKKILKRLKLETREDVVLIDSRPKTSASKASDESE